MNKNEMPKVQHQCLNRYQNSFMCEKPILISISLLVLSIKATSCILILFYGLCCYPIIKHWLWQITSFLIGVTFHIFCIYSIFKYFKETVTNLTLTYGRRTLSFDITSFQRSA